VRLEETSDAEWTVPGGPPVNTSRQAECDGGALGSARRRTGWAVPSERFRSVLGERPLADPLERSGAPTQPLEMITQRRRRRFPGGRGKLRPFGCPAEGAHDKGICNDRQRATTVRHAGVRRGAPPVIVLAARPVPSRGTQMVHSGSAPPLSNIPTAGAEATGSTGVPMPHIRKEGTSPSPTRS